MSPPRPSEIPDSTDSTVRPPQQARSRRTLERLEKAALELVARDGPDSVTVAQVVARARSSVGSFYARFQGKDELFLHLAEGLRRQALERWGALDVASAPDPVAATVGFLVEDEVQGAGRRRGLLAQGDSGAEGGEFTREVAAELHRGLAGDGGQAPSLDTVTLAVRTVRAALAALVAVSPAGRSPATAADGGEPVDPAALGPVLEAVVRVVLAGGGGAAGVEAAERVGEAAPATPGPAAGDVPVPDMAPAPVPDEFREPVVEGEVEEVEEGDELEEAGLDLPEAPLEDESHPVDPFDVWG